MMLDSIFYMYSNMDSKSQILLVLIVLVALMLISIFIINLIIKKKNERYDRLFNPIDKYANFVKKTKKNTLLEEKKVEVKQKIDLTSKDSKVKNEVIKEIPKIEEDKEELEIMEDPEVVEVISSDNSSIDKISMLIEDNLKTEKPIDLTKFEEEEEKNAIISYDELVKRAGAKKIVYKTEKSTINEDIKQEKIEVKSDENKKFKASQIISPIYGIKKNIEEKKEEIEEFIEIDDYVIDKNKSMNEQEMQNDMTFLTNLKTFRSKLD